MIPLVYSDGYDLNLGDHVFPAVKFKLIRNELAREGYTELHEPEPAAIEDATLAHTRAWVEGLRYGTLSYQQILQLEIPYSSKMVDAFFRSAGGTVLAARLALERGGVAMNIGGGFHHAFANHGEGFCALNDVAIAVRKLQSEGRVRRAMVLDVDVHQGNGTAGIFAEDASVFTISLHQRNNYPAEKPPSNIDVNFEDGTADSTYLGLLERVVEGALAGFAPELVMYVAGSDPYFDDKLGGLALSIDGLYRRDKLVFESCRRRGVPVAVTTAGGYAVLLKDTVTIHANTARAAVAARHG